MLTFAILAVIKSVPGGKGRVEFKDLDEMSELFGRSGVAVVLLCLARDSEASGGEPRGFAQLARAIVVHSGRYVPDGSISRSLKHLQADGLVRVADAGTRHPTYRLTDPGNEKAAVLTVLLTALREWKMAKKNSMSS